jgi:hypothetical protein
VNDRAHEGKGTEFLENELPQSLAMAASKSPAVDSGTKEASPAGCRGIHGVKAQMKSVICARQVWATGQSQAGAGESNRLKALRMVRHGYVRVRIPHTGYLCYAVYGFGTYG